MNPAGQVVMAAAARLYAPLAAAIALAVLVNSGADAELGLAAGLMLGFAPLLHALVFGADAAARAFPSWLARLMLAAGPLLAIGADLIAPGSLRATLTQAGVLVAATAATHLIATALIGRAPTLPDADW